MHGKSVIFQTHYTAPVNKMKNGNILPFVPCGLFSRTATAPGAESASPAALFCKGLLPRRTAHEHGQANASSQHQRKMKTASRKPAKWMNLSIVIAVVFSFLCAMSLNRAFHFPISNFLSATDYLQ